MKTITLCGLIFCYLSAFAVGAPATFTEFRELSLEQKRELFTNSLKDGASPYSIRVLGWVWRLQIGEEGWHRKEQVRLVSVNHNGTLEGFFNIYQGLRESCLRQEWFKKTGGISATEKARLGPEFGEIAKADATIRNNAIPLIAALAPSAEAKRLNEKAQQYVDDFYKKYPTYTISRQEMQVVDQIAQQMLEQVRKLPRLTPEQMQNAIDALPIDQSIPRGISVPDN